MNNKNILLIASFIFIFSFGISFFLRQYRQTLNKRDQSKRWVSVIGTIFEIIAVLALGLVVNVLLKLFTVRSYDGNSIASVSWLVELLVFLTVVLLTLFVAFFVRRRIMHNGTENNGFISMLAESVIGISHQRTERKKQIVLTPEAMQMNSEKKLEKRKKRTRRLQLVGIVVAVWLIFGLIMTLVFGKISFPLEFTLFPPDMLLGGVEIPESIVVSWVLMVIMTILALMLRIFVLPRFKIKPTSNVQVALEASVDKLAQYTKKMSDVNSGILNKYIFGVAVFLVFCSMTEFFGIRSPLTDLRLTGTLAILTFLILNYYGFRKKGLRGRIKSLASPSPIIFPIRVISDLAAPVSLACRLFGNMVGGMIVMQLLYLALSTFSAGIPAVLGLYFNIFEPVIQVYIFITLTLNYIREAVE